MLQIRRWSLVRQLNAGVFVLVTFVLALLLAVNSFQSRAVMLEQLDDDQQRLVGVLATQLNATHESILHQTERLARTFAEFYPADLIFDSLNVTTIGQYEAPSVYHQGELVNLNFEQVDRFARMTGGNATVFIRYQDDFLRVTTSLKNAQGQRAIGTLLGKSHPGYKQLLEGKAYVGEAHLFGTDYMTKYSPVRDRTGAVVAILYVGLPISDVMGELRRNLTAQTIGETGYLALIDLEDKRIPGKLIAHFEHQGKGFQDMYEALIGEGVSTVLESRNGKVAFNDSQNLGRDGVLHFQRVGEQQWIIYSLSYLDEFTGPVTRLMWWSAGLSLCAVFVLVLLLGAFLKSGLSPVAAMRDVLFKIGQGDLRHRFALSDSEGSQNELVQLQDSINAMSERFSSVISRVLSTGEGISESSATVASVSQAMSDLSRSSNEETVQVSVAIGQMAESVEEVSNSALAVAEDAGRTVSLSDNGSEVMNSVVRRVDSLQQEFLQAVDAVEKLRNDSTEIGKVVEVISSVAEQTNLLALNAAIEAARAGEQGRGFAVVADEVRTLAHRTQESTQEIQQVVAALQENAESASQRMTDGVVQIQDCVSEVEIAGNVLGDIKSAAKEVSNHMELVASATEEQSAVAAQISGSSEMLKQSAQKTASGAEDSAQAGARMSVQATELNEQVTQFKLV